MPNTKTYLINEQPLSSLDSRLLDLIVMIQKWLLDAVRDKSTGLGYQPPEDVIILACTNIIVNMIMNNVQMDTSVELRLKNFKHCLDGIITEAKDLWTTFEASKASDVTRN